MIATLGSVVYSFFDNHLTAMKGLRPSSVRSYRDVLQLFLVWVAQDAQHRLSKLTVADLSYERVQGFLRYLEAKRGNHPRTRNHRLAVLHTFFDYLASADPQMLIVAEKVAAIPAKRTPPAETHFLERAELSAVFEAVTGDSWMHRRDRALLLFLYNTGARVQEAADLRAGNIDFALPGRVRLHGKGDKWRVCPLWRETTDRLRRLLDERDVEWAEDSPQRHTVDPIRHLQDRQTPDSAHRHRAAGKPPVLDFPACLPTHDRSPPPRSRGGTQCHPRMAGACESGHHQSLCRDQHQGKRGSLASVSAAHNRGGVPPKTRLA